MRWLEWSGWTGLGGIASLVAVVGVAIALWQVFDGFVWRPAYGVSANVSRESASNSMTRVTVTARVMGNATLHEVEWISTVRIEFPPPVPALDARDEPLTLQVVVPTARLSEALVGIAWIEPRGTGPRRRAERWSLGREDARYESWVPQRKPIHRKLHTRAGHWKQSRPQGDYRPIDLPPMDDGDSQRRRRNSHSRDE